MLSFDTFFPSPQRPACLGLPPLPRPHLQCTRKLPVCPRLFISLQTLDTSLPPDARSAAPKHALHQTGPLSPSFLHPSFSFHRLPLPRFHFSIRFFLLSHLTNSADEPTQHAGTCRQLLVRPDTLVQILSHPAHANSATRHVHSLSFGKSISSRDHPHPHRHFISQKFFLLTSSTPLPGPPGQRLP